jgi:hypothetical protein
MEREFAFLAIKIERGKSFGKSIWVWVVESETLMPQIVCFPS